MLMARVADTRFCRYADDANVYVGLRRAGERVMQTLGAVCEQALATAGKPRQERGGSTVEAAVSGVHDDRAAHAEAEGGR